MSEIKNITARTILDSRGDWTVEAIVELENNISASASVPHGKSMGKNEVSTVEAHIAPHLIEREIKPALLGKDPSAQKDIDDTLLKLDETPKKEKIGGNAMLAVSLACARVSAVHDKIPLWAHLRKLMDLKGKPTNFPRLLVNVINGGLHAGNNLAFQEYLIMTKADALNKAVHDATSAYAALKKILENAYGPNAKNIGDEGGFAPNFENNLKPFEYIKKSLAEVKLEDMFDIGLDAAATDAKLSKEELSALYQTLKKEYNIAYIEDPFAEDDMDSFAGIMAQMSVSTVICADDLTTTNTERMKIVQEKKAANGIIIKPNQIGTLSQTLNAIKLAKEYNWNIIISHRSGETNDSFIADLAYAADAWGIKLGAPARGERIAKYNRLLEIEQYEIK